jgi:hypothetical protein
MYSSSQISLPQRSLWLITAIVATAIAMMIPNPEIVIYALYFPAPVGAPLSIAFGGDNEFSNMSLILGWVIYTPLVACCLVVKNRVVHRRFFIILSVLLLLNIAGCHSMIHDFQGMHINCQNTAKTQFASR